MQKIIFVILSFGFFSFGFTQQIIRPTGMTNGILSTQLPTSNQGNILAEPFEGQRFHTSDDMGNVEGNPLLFSNWKRGAVILKNGEKYEVEKINLDASQNKFLYSQNDTLYEFLDNVKEISIYADKNSLDPASDMVFVNNINPAANFVEVLAKGKITIYKEYSKKPKGENYSNGIVNNTRKYVLQTFPNAVIDNKILPVKFNSSTLDELTSDKKIKIDNYLKENNLKPKKEGDFIKAISYYNKISALS